MAQVNVIGRITADLELKTSEKSNPYVRFDIAENIGSRQTLHTQYFQVCAWGEDANRLMKAHAKKGSLIWVTGSLELEPYTKRDGISIESVMERKGNIPVFMIGSKLFKDVWRAPLIQEYPPLLYRPAEKTLPHCSECKYCYSVRQGKRGLWRACRHYKIVRQDKDSGGRHIPGRYAAVSPQWCPKRPETNWRFTKRV